MAVVPKKMQLCLRICNLHKLYLRRCSCAVFLGNLNALVWIVCKNVLSVLVSLQKVFSHRRKVFLNTCRRVPMPDTALSQN